MSITSWTHQFFWCHKKNGTFVCKFQIKNANFWLPRSFVWTDAKDATALRSYLDALTHKDKKLTVLLEEKGLAIDHVYEPEPECGVVRVDPFKLMALLRGEYVLEIPCSGRLLARDAGSKNAKYMPQEAQAFLLADRGLIHDAYVQRLREMVNAGEPVLCLTEEQANDPKMKELGVEIWNPASNLKKIPSFSNPAAIEGNATEHERELTRTQHDNHVEIIYVCGEYFTKRLYLLDGTPFFGASSYDKQKWSIFFSDVVMYDSIFAAECAS